MVALSVLATSAWPAAGQSEQPDVDQLLDAVQRGHAQEADAQREATKLHDAQQSMLGDYRAAQMQLSSLRAYNAQLAQLVQAERDRATNVQEQIDRVTQTGRDLMPLMERMVDSLAQFIELDIPFLLGERRKRVEGLRELLEQPETSSSEKYRRVLEAYQIELEFGRTIEAYRDRLGEGANARTVDFLRVGRIALLYMTLDKREVGGFDTKSRKFVTLGADVARALPQAIRVAREQVAPDLLLVPVPSPEEAK